MATIEAALTLALEKAVVTTAIGAEGIKVNPDEDIMIADSSQEFAQKIIYLLKHPEEAKNMGKKGRKLIEKYYSWESIGKKMHKVYAEVIGTEEKKTNWQFVSRGNNNQMVH